MISPGRFPAWWWMWEAGLNGAMSFFPLLRSNSPTGQTKPVALV
jgi:hypothetical protein